MDFIFDYVYRYISVSGSRWRGWTQRKLALRELNLERLKDQTSLKESIRRTREVAQQAGVCTALPQGLGLVLSTTLGASQPPLTPDPQDLMPLAFAGTHGSPVSKHI